MSPEMITLRPEIAEILREVASQPGSALLRVPRRDVARSVMETGAVAGARGATLSEAERHLVQAHREELAFVLRQAAYLRLNEGVDSRHLMVDRALPHLRDQIPTEKEVRVRGSQALRGDSGHGEEPEVIQLLEQCVASTVSVWASAGQLAAASHRLVPTDAARMSAALYSISTGAPSNAILILRLVLAHHCTEALERAAWVHASLAFVRMASPARALDCTRVAASLNPLDWSIQLNRIWIAADLGIEEEVRLAGSALSVQLDASSVETEKLIDWYRSARLVRGAEISSGVRFLRRFADEWTPTLRRLLHDDR